MSKFQISWPKVTRPGSELGDLARTSHLPAASAPDPAGRSLGWFSANGSRVTLERPGRLNATGLLYVCVIGLTGCATSAELDSLRAEVARANAIAARAEASVSRTQNQLAALKASSEPPEVISSPPAPPASTSTATVTSGYKWGKLQQT